MNDDTPLANPAPKLGREACHCWSQQPHRMHDWDRILGGAMWCPGIKADGSTVIVGEPPRIEKINGRRT